MYLNFQIFGDKSWWGGASPGPKCGQVSDGGLTTFLPVGGTPSPPGKKPCFSQKKKNELQTKTTKYGGGVYRKPIRRTIHIP